MIYPCLLQKSDGNSPTHLFLNTSEMITAFCMSFKVDAMQSLT